MGHQGEVPGELDLADGGTAHAGAGRGDVGPAGGARPEPVGPGTVRGIMLRTERAAALLRAGNLAEAATEFADVAGWCERIFGPRDERTLTSRTNLATTLFKLGHLDRAEAEYRRVVEDQPEDADGVAHNNLGTVLFHLGRVREADPLLRQAQQMHRRTSAAGAPHTTRAVVNLVRALAGLGHRAEARALAEDYLRMYPDGSPSRPERLGEVRRILAEL